MLPLKSLCENAPKIIREAARSWLGILALAVLSFATIAIVFFHNASEPVKVIAFALILLGAALFVVKVLHLASQERSKDESDVTPEPRELRQEAGDGSAVQIISEGGSDQQITVGDVSTGSASGQANAVGKITVQGDLHIHVFDYLDGVAESPKRQMRELFRKGREAALRGEFVEATRFFGDLLEIEEDPEKRSAVHLQMGNAHRSLGRHLRTAECYAAALREAERAQDQQGIASALGSIGNTYRQRPASTSKRRGKNVGEAVDRYLRALEIFTENEYPVGFAATRATWAMRIRLCPPQRQTSVARTSARPSNATTPPWRYERRTNPRSTIARQRPILGCCWPRRAIRRPAIG